ncbi:SLATT domain-containing protein [Actimicrobium antarcticum]|uniref:SMODS and SLOG-associating 2TM effector domain-containing protein n=1 Tax=Actimicrobium antarcticum TaxID=1051899 RepID=A0ABP7TP13_9BURK
MYSETQYGPLLADWLRRFHHLKSAHFRAAWHFEHRHRRYGRVTVALSTIVPPVLVLLGQPDTRTVLTGLPYIFLALGLIAAIAGTLATLQIFDRDSERAERHRVAGSSYAKLEADLELLIASMPAAAQVANQVSEFRDEWSRVTGGSPVIPEWLFKQVEQEVEKPSALLLRIQQPRSANDA